MPEKNVRRFAEPPPLAELLEPFVHTVTLEEGDLAGPGAELLRREAAFGERLSGRDVHSSEKTRFSSAGPASARSGRGLKSWTSRERKPGREPQSPR